MRNSHNSAGWITSNAVSNLALVSLSTVVLYIGMGMVPSTMDVWGYDIKERGWQWLN